MKITLSRRTLLGWSAFLVGQFLLGELAVAGSNGVVDGASDELQRGIEDAANESVRIGVGKLRDAVNCRLWGQCPAAVPASPGAVPPTVSSPPVDAAPPKGSRTDASRIDAQLEVQPPFGIDWMDSPVDVARKLSARSDLREISFGGFKPKEARSLTRDEILSEWTKNSNKALGLDKPYAVSVPHLSAEFGSGNETMGVTIGFIPTPGMMLSDRSRLEMTSPVYLGGVVGIVEVFGHLEVPTCDKIMATIEQRHGVRRSGPESGTQGVSFEGPQSSVSVSRFWDGMRTVTSCSATYAANAHAVRLNEEFNRWAPAEIARRRDAEAGKIRSGSPSRMANGF